MPWSCRIPTDPGGRRARLPPASVKNRSGQLRRHIDAGDFRGEPLRPPAVWFRRWQSSCASREIAGERLNEPLSVAPPSTTLAPNEGEGHQQDESEEQRRNGNSNRDARVGAS